MSEPTKPTRWHLGVEIGKNEADEYLVCPECGEYVTTTTPVDWTPAWGPAPGFSHLLDGSPLCPVIGTGDGVSGLVPATACSRREYDDANGCPCDTVYWCQCSCGDCFCRQAGIAPVDQVAAHGLDTRGSLIGGVPSSGKSAPFWVTAADEVEIPALMDDWDGKLEQKEREYTHDVLRLELGEDLDGGPDDGGTGEGVISHG